MYYLYTFSPALSMAFANIFSQMGNILSAEARATPRLPEKGKKGPLPGHGSGPLIGRGET